MKEQLLIKAAHFIIKNYLFSDGNKRSGAFLFVDFPHRNHRLLDANGHPVINEIGLAALALLVAESAAMVEAYWRIGQRIVEEGQSVNVAYFTPFSSDNRMFVIRLFFIMRTIVVLKKSVFLNTRALSC